MSSELTNLQAKVANLEKSVAAMGNAIGGMMMLFVLLITYIKSCYKKAIPQNDSCVGKERRRGDLQEGGQEKVQIMGI